MTTTVTRWRVFCVTDSQFEYVWQTSVPTVCPVNAGHSVNSSGINDDGDEIEVVTVTSGQSPFTTINSNVFGDTSGGNITINLPAAHLTKNGRLLFKKTSALNSLILNPDGAELIDGLSTKTLSANGETVIIESDCIGWNLVAISEDVDPFRINLPVPSDTIVGLIPDTNISSSSVTQHQGDIDHGSITGLAGDDHTQYALLNGRSSGQTLTGGTGAGDSLTLNSTSNVTKGKIILNDPIDISDTSKDHSYQVIPSELAANRQLTLPVMSANDTFALLNTAQTLTNKTITSASNTLTLDAADITSGTLPVTRGGTGATTFESGSWLRGNGTGAIVPVKSNLASATDPAVTDDSASGYAVGSKWLNTTNNRAYVCLNASVGAAVWKETTINTRIFDAIVDATGAGDYTLPSAAFAAGAISVMVKTGTYIETADINIPDNGLLTAEAPGEAVIVLGANRIVCDGSGGVVESAGTISVTNGSTAVTGSGTTFTNLAADDRIRVNGVFYEIASITDNTNLTLKNAFRGVTQSGLSYIAQTMHAGMAITNLLIANGTAEAIFIRGVIHGIVRECFITNCGANSLSFVDSSECVIMATVVENSAGDGMYFDRCSFLHMSGGGAKGCISDGLCILNTSDLLLDSILMVHNGGNGTFVTGATSTRNEITDSIFTHNSLEGFETAAGAGSVTLGSCHLTYNGGFGIDFDGVDNIVTGCVISSNKGGGVQAGDANVITSNQINNNTGVGINMNGDTDCTISGNVIDGNTTNGIAFTSSSSNNTITGNVIINNGTDGIDFETTSTNNMVAGNVILNNTTTGIDGRGDNNVFSSNRITGSTNGVIIGGTGTIVFGNHVTGNTTDWTDTGTGTITGIGYVAHGISDSQLNTSSGGFVQKMRLTTPSLSLGTYRIGWSGVINNNSGSGGEYRIQLNDSTTIGTGNGTDSSTPGFVSIAGFYYGVLSGVQNIDLDVLAISGTTSIKETRLEIFRVK